MALAERGEGGDFQLTTSHGGRRSDTGLSGGHSSFNSRPHTEVDVSSSPRHTASVSFNSRPHTEVDHDRSVLVP